MSFIKDYVEYLRDNPEGYWFKRKAFGWGWTPVTWQGWLVILVYIAIILALVFSLSNSSTGEEVALIFLLPFIILTALLICICYKKGEKPKWTWGFPKKSSNEDINSKTIQGDSE